MATEDDIASEVSWQTAFFLLFGIAFLAISQPCGQFLGMHSKYRFWLRTSPFLCLADTLIIIAQFHYYSAKGDGPQDALRRIIRTRFAGTTPTLESADQINLTTLIPLEVDITEESLLNASLPSPRDENIPLHIYPKDGETLASVEEKLYLRFILGVFPLFPAIKLYTLTGIPWTQAFAAMYIASILSVEVLLWCTRPYEQVPLLAMLDSDIFTSDAFTIARYFETIIIRRTGRTFPLRRYLRRYLLPASLIYFLTLAILQETSQEILSTVICSVLYAITIFDIVIDAAKTGTNNTLLSCFCPWLLLLHSFFLFQYTFSYIILVTNVWLEIIHLILFIASILVFEPLRRNSTGSAVLAISFALAMSTIIFGLLLEFLDSGDILLGDYFLWFLIIAAIELLLFPLRLPQYHKYKYIVFAADNLFTFLLYYAYAYNPTGTIDPGWESIWG